MAGEIILEKRANHWRGMLADGGHLVLTKTQLTFLPHRFNIRGKRVIIDLKDICEILKVNIGFSSEIHVRPKSGQVERFVVWGRDELIEAINKQIAENRQNMKLIKV